MFQEADVLSYLIIFQAKAFLISVHVPDLQTIRKMGTLYYLQV